MAAMERLRSTALCNVKYIVVSSEILGKKFTVDSWKSKAGKTGDRFGEGADRLS